MAYTLNKNDGKIIFENDAKTQKSQFVENIFKAVSHGGNYILCDGTLLKYSRIGCYGSNGSKFDWLFIIKEYINCIRWYG